MRPRDFYGNEMPDLLDHPTNDGAIDPFDMPLFDVQDHDETFDEIDLND